MPNIFINYRRSDTPAHASRLYEWLSDRYGDEQVFKDIDSIQPGLDFEEAIERAVGESDVVITLIGREWVQDGQGRRRLDDPDDFVRMEIEAALNRNIRVIPVLVEGASMPAAAELPESLRRLTRRHAFELSDTRWRFDKEELLKRLDNVLGISAPAREPAPEQAPVVPAPVPAPPEVEKERSAGPAKWGWILTAGSLIVPFLAIGAIICGALVISRSSGKRTGLGFGIIAAALIVGLLSFSFWIGVSGG
jgi:hypothetical protein